MNSKLVIIMAMTALISGTGTQAANAPSRTGTVLLTLAEGVAPVTEGDRVTQDMDLELTLRDGKFDPAVWGYGLAFNKGHHDGQIVSADGDNLTIKLTLNRDPWWAIQDGAAEYQIRLKRDGDSFAGTFTGTLRYRNPAAAPKPDDSLAKGLRAMLATSGQTGDVKPKVNDTPAPAPAPDEGLVKRDVKGAVTGKVYPSWTEPVAGFKKLEPNEHPRLLFRKSDLPTLKKRLETPEGKAIMARFLEVLPKNPATHDKCQPYFPAGYGLAYQLTGDKQHAVKAKEILASMLDLSGSQDIHYGPQAQAIAVTLDLCYDAWDAEFRQRVINNLAARLGSLDKVTGMGGASLNPWHNHEAIRVAGTGLAAICLLGEKTSGGKEIAGLERIIHTSALATRRFFQYNGTSNTGWWLEGKGYKRMTWNSGPGHMIQAYRTAFGGDLMAGWPGHWSILGEWMGQPPTNSVVTSEGVWDDQYSGQFVLGLTTVPDSMKAGARWLFDRAYGLEGDKTFGLLWAYHAGYLLMNYPFDVAPKPPGDSLPWIAPDPTGGHWIFRRPWQGGNDTLVVLNPRFDFPGGTHWTVGRSWDMQLFALGRQWIGDREMAEKTGTPGAALPTVANPGAFNDAVSARLTDWSATADGAAVLSFDMSPIYMQTARKDGVPAAGQKLVRMGRSGSFIDFGIRAKRAVAVDLTGTSGAPVLYVVIDQSQGAKDLTWNLKLAQEAGAAKVEGNTVIVGDPAGANMKCTFLAPVSPKLTGAIKATGGDEYYAIITIQNGAAPEIKVDGTGLGAKVTVGKRKIQFDGEKFVLQ